MNVGQAVTAFSAATLFRIVKNYQRMLVVAGGQRSGHRADSHEHAREVRRQRLSGRDVCGNGDANPSPRHDDGGGRGTKGVSYTVAVAINNADGRLLPSLTVSKVQFEVKRRSGVLLVPQAALRWHPQPEETRSNAHPTAVGKARREGTGSGTRGQGEIARDGQGPQESGDACGWKTVPSSARWKSASGERRPINGN